MASSANETFNLPIIPLSWEEIDNIVSTLAVKVIEDGIPDIILGLQRGGIIPSVILSHLLGVRRLFTFNISRTIHDGVNAEKLTPVLGYNIPLEFINNRDILIVDDISGSGDTLRALYSILNGYSPSRVRSLVCIVNRNNWEPVNSIEPNAFISYIGRECRGWIIFPWEKNEGSM